MHRLGAPLLVLVAAAAAACDPSLAVTAVAPRVVEVGAGAELTVTGAGFSSTVLFSLVGPGATIGLGDVVVDGDTQARATLPVATPEGSYALVAARGGTTAELAVAVDVVGGGAKVVFIDVGQGEATVVRAASGEVMLFEGGDRTAAAAVRAAVDTHSGGRLDVVGLSQLDADHTAGLVHLLRGPDNRAGTDDDIIPPVRFGPPDDGSCTSDICAEYRRLRAYPFAPVQVGDVIPLGDLDVVVVAAGGDVGDGVLPGADSVNERSIALRLAFAGHTVLLPTDLTGGGNGDADVEGPLSLKTGPVDVMEVGHHGSNTSSSAAALARWQPRAVVISVGTDNQFCHPTAAVLARLAQTGARIYATGRGMVEEGARCDGPTVWPAGARPGVGDVVLELRTGGDVIVAGDKL